MDIFVRDIDMRWSGNVKQSSKKNWLCKLWMREF